MCKDENKDEIVLGEKVQVVQMWSAIEPLDEEETKLLLMETEYEVGVAWRTVLSSSDREQRIGFNLVLEEECGEETLHEIFKHLLGRASNRGADRYEFTPGIRIHHESVMVPSSQLVAIMNDVESKEPDHHLTINTSFGDFAIDEMTGWEFLDEKLIDLGVICFLWNFQE